MRLATILIAASMAGCSAMPRMDFSTPAARNAEVTWQALQLVDTMQTVAIARNPSCLYEKNPLASAIYGTKHPSVERVVATNVIASIAHWAIGSWLDRGVEESVASDSGSTGLWVIGRGAYYGASILGSGAAVAGNFRLGVRPLAANQCRRRDR